MKKFDGRIWRDPITVFASVQQSAEKIVRQDFGDRVLHIELKLKADEYDDPRFSKYNYEWIHEGIAPTKTLKRFNIEVPPNQNKPFLYPDGKTIKEVLEEDTVIESVESAPVKTRTSKYKNVKCKWCDDDIPSNGAAQFSHLKKHINQLVERGILNKSQASKIRSIKLDNKHEKIFADAFC